MNLKSLKYYYNVGDLRQSQLISTFGIGSMVDFVNQTVMICGIDDWDENASEKIHNPNLQKLLGVKYFLAPQVSKKNYIWQKDRKDIKAKIFPTWLYSPKCGRLVKARRGLLKGDGDNAAFYCDCVECKNKTRLLPSPFILICPEGHIEDFPYFWWIHKDQNGECPEGNKGSLSMYYRGNKTSLDNLYIKCSCGAFKSMRSATGRSSFAGYKCTGNRPWLGDKVECHAYEHKQYMQMRGKAETSVYFPAVVSALVIPPWDSPMYLDILNVISPMKAYINSIVIESFVRRYMDKYLDATEKDIRDCINRALESDSDKTMADLMWDEYNAFNMPCDEEHANDFVIRNMVVPETYNHIIKRVIAVDRLTVVSAMAGFSMLTAEPYDYPGLCKLSKKQKEWLPGVVQKGEGIFMEFNQGLLNDWSDIYGDRYNEMKSNHANFGLCKGNFSAQYVFLHTFAHLFIREISFICGYSTPSIRERIYSTYLGSNDKMCGILVYTSTPDADGSLGGLVEQAETENMEKILSSLMERGRWCSSDPVCYLSKGQGYHSLNYAACFACTLLPETSCESFNGLLDRCSVCGNPDDEILGIMNWEKP